MARQRVPTAGQTDLNPEVLRPQAKPSELKISPFDLQKNTQAGELITALAGFDKGVKDAFSFANRELSAQEKQDISDRVNLDYGSKSVSELSNDIASQPAGMHPFGYTALKRLAGHRIGLEEKEKTAQELAAIPDLATKNPEEVSQAIEKRLKERAGNDPTVFRGIQNAVGDIRAAVGQSITQSRVKDIEAKRDDDLGAIMYAGVKGVQDYKKVRDAIRTISSDARLTGLPYTKQTGLWAGLAQRLSSEPGNETAVDELLKHDRGGTGTVESLLTPGAGAKLRAQAKAATANETYDRIGRDTSILQDRINRGENPPSDKEIMDYFEKNKAGLKPGFPEDMKLQRDSVISKQTNAVNKQRVERQTAFIKEQAIVDPTLTSDMSEGRSADVKDKVYFLPPDGSRAISREELEASGKVADPTWSQVKVSRDEQIDGWLRRSSDALERQGKDTKQTGEQIRAQQVSLYATHGKADPRLTAAFELAGSGGIGNAPASKGQLQALEEIRQAQDLAPGVVRENIKGDAAFRYTSAYSAFRSMGADRLEAEMRARAVRDAPAPSISQEDIKKTSEKALKSLGNGYFSSGIANETTSADGQTGTEMNLIIKRYASLGIPLERVKELALKEFQQSFVGLNGSAVRVSEFRTSTGARVSPQEALTSLEDAVDDFKKNHPEYKNSKVTMMSSGNGVIPLVDGLPIYSKPKAFADVWDSHLTAKERRRLETLTPKSKGLSTGLDSLSNSQLNDLINPADPSQPRLQL